MIAVILNHNNSDNASYLKDLFSMDMVSCVIDSGSKDCKDDFIPLGNVYYTALFNEAAKLAKNWLILITSDISIDEINYRKMMSRIKTLQNVGCYGPSLTHHSKCHEFLKTQGKGLRDVKFNEGFFTMIRKDVLDKVAPVPTTNRYGWGIDILTGFQCSQLGLRCVVDDDVVITHPHGTGYELYDASTQMYEYFQDYKSPEFSEFIKGIA